MEYVRIEENLPDSAKMLRIPRKHRALCLGLYVRALCYCSRHETDGAFPVGLVDDHESASMMLIDVALFDCINAESLAIHDYLDYNRSKAEIEALRQVRREAGAKGGKAKVANAKQSASKTVAEGKPILPKDNYIDIEGQDTSSSKPDDGFAEFWSAYPRKVGKGAARKAWKGAVKKAPAVDIIKALKAYTFDRRDDGKYIPHPATWLNAERWDDEQVPFLPDEEYNFSDPSGWKA